MTGLVWISIFAGVVIGALAVGIPYLLTHKGMRSPHDLSEGRAYMQAKRRWLRQRTAAPGQSEQAARAAVRGGTSSPMPATEPADAADD